MGRSMAKRDGPSCSGWANARTLVRDTVKGDEDDGLHDGRASEFETRRGVRTSATDSLEYPCSQVEYKGEIVGDDHEALEISIRQ